MTSGEEDPEQKMGPIAATRAVRRRVQKFKAEHHLKNANEVLVCLLDNYETKGGISFEGHD